MPVVSPLRSHLAKPLAYTQHGMVSPAQPLDEWSGGGNRGRVFHTPTLSLVEEALGARSWIDDPRRTRHGSRMTPALFRRWLKEKCGKKILATFEQAR